MPMMTSQVLKSVDFIKKLVYVTIWNPYFCPVFYLTGAHFLGEPQHVRDVSQQKIKCWPIRTREIGGVTLADVLYKKQKYLDIRDITLFLSNKKVINYTLRVTVWQGRTL